MPGRENLSIELNEALEEAVEQQAKFDSSLIDQHGGQEAYERLNNVLAYARLVIAGTDPDLVTNDAVTQLKDALLLTARLEYGHFETHAEAVAGLLMRFPASRGDDWEQQAKDAALRFQQAMAQRVNTVDAQLRAAQGTLNTLDGTIEQQRQTIEGQQARLDNAIAEYQQQFSAAEAQRTSTFTDQLEATRTGLEELSAGAKEDIRQRIAGFEAQASEGIQTLEGYQDEAKKLMTVLGNTGLTAAYQRLANEENKAANTWRWTTLGAFALAAVANGIALAVELHWGSDFQSLLSARLSISIPLLALGAYAIAESSGHRKEERENRSIELQLASIGPYLAELDPTAQHKVRENMFIRFFPGRSFGFATATDPPEDSGEE